MLPYCAAVAQTFAAAGSRTRARASGLTLGVLRDPLVAALLVAGLAARLVYGFTGEISRILGDQIVYRQLGHQFTSWWAGSDLTRTPAYPLFVHLGYAVSGGRDGAVVLGQCVLMTAACAVLTLVAAQLGGRTAAIACAVVTTLWTPLLTITGLILSETLAGAALTGAVAAPILGHRRPLTAGAISGAMAAVAVLTRPNLLVGTPFLLLTALLLIAPGRPRLRLLAAFLAAGALVFAPWVVRNLATASAAAPLGRSPASSYNTAAGVHMPSDHTSGRYGAYLRSLHFFANQAPPGVVTAATVQRVHAGAELRHRLVHDPLGQASDSLFWLKELLIYPFEDHAQYGQPGPLPWVPQMIVHLAILALALLGALIAWRSRTVWALLAPAVAICLPFAVLWSSPRYAIPALMLVAPLAAAAVSWLAGRLTRRAAAA